MTSHTYHFPVSKASGVFLRAPEAKEVRRTPMAEQTGIFITRLKHPTLVHSVALAQPKGLVTETVMSQKVRPIRIALGLLAISWVCVRIREKELSLPQG